MRILILSCNTGEGHNSCAKAIKEVFDSLGDTCVIADALTFISEGTSRFFSSGHILLYRRFPRLFRKSYSLTEKKPNIFKSDSPLYKFFARGSTRLYEKIHQEQYQVVICSHPFAAIMLTETQRRYQPDLKTALIITDYTCSPCVKDCKPDYCFIPTPSLFNDFECTNLPRKKLIASGIPIRQSFYTDTDKIIAKQTLGISENRPHIVIMGGSMGCGPIKELAGKLASLRDGAFDISVICGTNESCKNELLKAYSSMDNMHIHGYIDNIPLMLDSADLYVTKPGGISVTEAITKRVPMVLIDAVGGCEEYNRLFWISEGVAVSGKTTQELVHLCENILCDPLYYKHMQTCLRSMPRQNAAQIICHVMRHSIQKR